MQQYSLICILSLVAAATAAGLFGGINVDPNSAAAQGGVTFPRIPGLNSPLFGFSLFPPRNGSGGPGGSLFDRLPQLPNITSLVPELPNSENATSVFVPSISDLPSLSSGPYIPGLSEALQVARNHVQTALDLGNNFTDGIRTALEQAFQSNDPTSAVRTIVNTILNAYLTVAENCPLIVVGTRVLQEGIRLAAEVAQAARNVILGPSH